MVSLTRELLESGCKLWMSCGYKGVTLRRFRFERNLGRPVSSTSWDSMIIASYNTVQLFAFLLGIIWDDHFMPFPIFCNLSSAGCGLSGSLIRAHHNETLLTYT